MATTKIPKKWKISKSEKDFLYYESYCITKKLIEAIRSQDVDAFSINVEILESNAKRLKKDAVADIISLNH